MKLDSPLVSEITGKAWLLKWRGSAAACCVHAINIYTVDKYAPAAADFVFFRLKV